jgi:hypothetical protein
MTAAIGPVFSAHWLKKQIEDDGQHAPSFEFQLSSRKQAPTTKSQKSIHAGVGD